MMHQHHDHSATADTPTWRLTLSIAINLLLTVVQVVAGLLSGSLALVADALHNFSDCASLLIALIARRISRRPADTSQTFGYKRAETVAALINLTLLVVIASYLIFEAVGRTFEPQKIDGWVVIIVALVAFVVDLGTAILLASLSKGNLNLRAAFLHNVTDALASLAVVAVGVLILLWNLTISDLVITLFISAYILWQSLAMLRQTIGVLMNAVPQDIDIDSLVNELERLEGVQGVHHVHVWQMDEDARSLEAHVVVNDLELMEEIKWTIKRWLSDKQGIHHSTLEFELPGVDCDTSVISDHKH